MIGDYKCEEHSYNTYHDFVIENGLEDMFEDVFGEEFTTDYYIGSDDSIIYEMLDSKLNEIYGDKTITADTKFVDPEYQQAYIKVIVIKKEK